MVRHRWHSNADCLFYFKNFHKLCNSRVMATLRNEIDFSLTSNVFTNFLNECLHSYVCPKNFSLWFEIYVMKWNVMLKKLPFSIKYNLNKVQTWWYNIAMTLLFYRPWKTSTGDVLLFWLLVLSFRVIYTSFQKCR